MKTNKNPYNSKVKLDKSKSKNNISYSSSDTKIYDSNKKNIYETQFKTSSIIENEQLKKDRVDYYKNTKSEILSTGKDNANNEIFETKNSKKDFGKNRYFVETSDGTSTQIYRVKKNLKSYSPSKNSELVYSLNMDRNNLNNIQNGKRVLTWNEKGINSKF